MQAKDKPLTIGAITIRRGVILAVGIASDIIREYPSHRIVRIMNAVLMPGLINLHTHLELPPLLDEIRAESFSDWVMNLIRAKKRFTLSDYRAATAANIQALIASGTTTVGEISTHDASLALLKKSGLRALVFKEIISMSQDSGIPFTPRVPVGNRNALVRSGISPHAPYTVSEPMLLKIGQYADHKKQPLAMHVAESKYEVRFLQGKKSGLEKLYRFAGWDKAWAPSADSPFEYLVKLGLSGPDFLAVHAVQATDRDIRLLSKSRTPVAHCPRSNKELGVGRMPLRKFLDAGITVGLGTDSLASVPTLNMWDEMRYAYKIHKRDGVSAQDIFRIATLGGAKALGLGKETGSLEVGKQADIIAVPLPKKNTGDLYSDLLRETKSCIMNMVNGKMLYRG